MQSIDDSIQASLSLFLKTIAAVSLLETNNFLNIESHLNEQNLKSSSSVNKLQFNWFLNIINILLKIKTNLFLNIYYCNIQTQLKIKQNVINKFNLLLFNKTNTSTNICLMLKMKKLIILISFLCLLTTFLIKTVDANEKHCISCSLQSFEEYKRIRQEQILNDLLQKLELSAKPNVTVDYDNLPPIGRNNPRIKALIEQSLRENHRRIRKSFRSIDLTLQNTDDDSVESYKNNYFYNNDVKGYYPSLYQNDGQVMPEISYIVAEQPPVWFNQEEQVAFFRFSPNLCRKYINKALLTVLLKQPKKNRFLQNSIRIEVYERYQNGTLGKKIGTKHQKIYNDSDISMQVQVRLNEKEIQHWLTRENFDEDEDDDDLNNNNLYVGLYVQAIYYNENVVIYSNDMNNSQIKNIMFMEIEALDRNNRVSRLRRSTQLNVCRPGSNETKCCLYDLMIDFEKVGWDFVVAPKRYNAYICNGECTQSQMSQTARGTVARRAHLDYFQCCHPKEYSAITIVYVTDSNQIWVKEVPGMVARRCGCA